MLKRFSVVVFLALFLVFSVNLFAANSVTSKTDATKEKPVLFNLFNTGEGVDGFSASKYVPGGGLSLLPPTGRQLYTNFTSRRDYEHNTVSGRQIVYAGYYNAGCDYVYMDWADKTLSPTLYNVKVALFDWGTAHDWDYVGGGMFLGSPQGAYYPNMDATPDNGWGVTGYHHTPTTKTYSHVSFASECLGTTYQQDSMPGPPNVQGINTGYCVETGADQAYIWPKIDVDTNSAGAVIVHAASNETVCPTTDTQIDVSSIVYYRKVETTPNQPWTGTWEGPTFIDSAYMISQLVRADKNGPNVYYVYLKPMFYQVGSPHTTCTNGLGHYQTCSDVVYKVSTDDGANWSTTPTYITDFKSNFVDGGTEPAVYDLSALVDPNGVLHVVWVSNNRGTVEDVDDSECTQYYASRMWHWDSFNNCISLAYDASYPALFTGYIPVFTNTINRPNISWCDDKYYISFTRYGGNPTTDSVSRDVGTYTVVSGDINGNGIEDDSTYVQNGEIFIVGSDAVTGGSGKTWSQGYNLTNTAITDLADTCLPGDCFSETWATMAMYSTDSLMIEYLEDKDPGYAHVGDASETDNPVVFMTWPCFAMESNACLSFSPTVTDFPEIALAPNGSTGGCTTPASYAGSVTLSNCGNSSLGVTASANQTWINVTPSSDNVDAGVGPRGITMAWAGAPGCASPTVFDYTISSATLAAGNYSGTITLDVDDGSIDDVVLTFGVVVACEYYVPEYAEVTSGCWTVDLWNTPQAGNDPDERGSAAGNMQFSTCGADTSYHPLFSEAVILGWKVGSDIYCFTDNSDDHMVDLLPAVPNMNNARMRALSNIVVDSVGTPSSGIGYTHTQGYFCTPDSSVYGSIEYFVPGHLDTAVIIEKLTVWNESGSALGDFVIGEGIDWDMERDSNYDGGGIDFGDEMVYQYGAGTDVTYYAGLQVISGDDGSIGAETIPNQDWIYPDTGFNVIDIYNKLTSMDGSFAVFSDSLTDISSIFRFWEGTLGTTDTVTIVKVKTATAGGLTDLKDKFAKAVTFYDNYFSGDCDGECGDANKDTKVNVSDAVFLINYVFSGGDEPRPVKACGDVNNDTKVNVSDAVYLINYVFSGGNPPGLCSPGVFPGGDCCPFEAK